MIVSDFADITATQRTKELRRIRQIFIPDLVLRLHTLLISHSQFFPDLVQTALELTKTVAREDNHVYEEFLGGGAGGDGVGKLGVYLERVREAGMMAIQMGGTGFQIGL